MESNNLERRQVLDRIKALEDGFLKPKELSRGAIKECICVMKEREYSSCRDGADSTDESEECTEVYEETKRREFSSLEY